MRRTKKKHQAEAMKIGYAKMVHSAAGFLVAIDATITAIALTERPVSIRGPPSCQASCSASPAAVLAFNQSHFMAPAAPRAEWTSHHTSASLEHVRLREVRQTGGSSLRLLLHEAEASGNI